MAGYWCKVVESDKQWAIEVLLDDNKSILLRMPIWDYSQLGDHIAKQLLETICEKSNKSS